jgi:hypothetical protein
VGHAVHRTDTDHRDRAGKEKNPAGNAEAMKQAAGFEISLGFSHRTQNEMA